MDGETWWWTSEGGVAPPLPGPAGLPGVPGEQHEPAQEQQLVHLPHITFDLQGVQRDSCLLMLTATLFAVAMPDIHEIMNYT